jgi:hypothetical protein
MNNIATVNKLILDEVTKLDVKRHPKYTNSYYVDMMMNLLKDANNWSFLKNIKGYGSTQENIPKYHYETIKNKFNHWTLLVS